MEENRPNLRRRAFYLILLAECLVLAPLLMSSPRGAYGVIYAYYLVLAATIALGFVNALVASIPKPRWKFALATLAVHTVALAFQVAEWAPRYEDALAIDAAYEERENDEKRQQKWSKELTALIVAKRYGDARQYIRDHSFLVANDGEPFRKALCPADGSAPDYELLLELGQRGAPSGGDRIVEAAKCSLDAFRALLAAGKLDVTITSGDDRTALTSATDPAILTFLLEQGLDVNVRDAHGRTPLMYHRSADVTRFLLAHGADPKAVDKKNYSVLHFGGPEDELGEIFELLLEAGADPNHEVALPSLRNKTRPLEALSCFEHTPGEKIFDTQWSQAAADALVKHGAMMEDQLAAIDCILGSHSIESALRWPGLDLSGAGGANLLVNASVGHRELIPLLLEAGANPLAQNEQKRTGLRSYQDGYGKLDPSHPMDQLMIAAVHRFSLRDAGR